MTSLLDQVVARLDFEPFTYLAITIGGVIVWTFLSVIGTPALTGRTLWMRRLALLVAAAGTVLFAYTASTLR